MPKTEAKMMIIDVAAFKIYGNVLGYRGDGGTLGQKIHFCIYLNFRFSGMQLCHIK